MSFDFAFLKIHPLTHKIVIYLLVFWSMQVTAQVFFKWGSLSPASWIWGFLVGNLFGFSSIWLLMLCYKSMNPNVVLGISTGGAFILCQIVLAMVFKSKVEPLQWAGIAVITGGILMVSMGSVATDSATAGKLPKPIKQTTINQ